MRFVLQRRPTCRRRNRNWIAKGKTTHALAATAIATAAPSVGAPAFGQIHALAASSIASGVPSAGAPAISQTHVLSATAIASGAPSAGAPAFGGTASPILIEGEDYDLPRADRKRVYDKRLRTDLEEAARTLQATKATISWDAPQIAPPSDNQRPGSDFRAPRLLAPSSAVAHARNAAREEEDDEDALLLVL